MKYEYKVIRMPYPLSNERYAKERQYDVEQATKRNDSGPLPNDIMSEMQFIDQLNQLGNERWQVSGLYPSNAMGYGMNVLMMRELI